MIDRRGFNRESLVALFSGVAVTISGCGGGAGYDSAAPTAPSAANPTPPPTGSDNTVTGRQGSISGNHGHAAILTSAEFGAAGGVILNIQGQADHPHMLELTETEIDAIASGESVSKPTTAARGHDHRVTFGASEPTPDDY
jgi:hypothetical protein